MCDYLLSLLWKNMKKAGCKFIRGTLNIYKEFLVFLMFVAKHANGNKLQKCMCIKCHLIEWKKFF